MADKKIVITGATGFIGNALSQSLKNITGISVVPVTRVKNKQGFYFSSNYRDLPLGEVLVHLGEDSDRIRVNSAGEMYRREANKVVDSILDRGYKHIIYSSSAVVYGDSGTMPYTEDMPVYPFDSYSMSKLENEDKILAVGGSVVRLVNVVGPGMASNNVLSDIITQLSEAGPVVVRNSKPIRDFVGLYDVIEALMLLIQKRVPGIYNVGTGSDVSIHDLAQLCLAIDGQEERKVVSTSNTSTYSYNVVDTRKIKDVLGWVPSISLSNSIINLLGENLQNQ